jgi:DNA-binding NarL/FixJ family response regulator
MTIRVVLADDQALIRAGFRLLIDAAPDLTVVGEASDGAQAVEIVRATRADVVLMDIRMPGIDGIEATRMITSDDDLAGVKIITLTTFEIDQHVLEAIRAGASGFLGPPLTPSHPRHTHGLRSRGARRRRIGRRQRRSRAARSPDRPRTRGDEARRTRPHQRRHRRAPLPLTPHRQDARQPSDDEAERSRPSATRRPRLPDRTRPPRRTSR